MNNTRGSCYRLILTFLLVLISFSMRSQKYDEKVRQLEQYIEKARVEWKVPGLAAAVIKDGQVQLLRGFGVSNLETGKEVNAQTLFAICSTTKAMTAAGMAILVDEGRVKWNDRVIEHLPDFRLSDPYVTRELRIRDLFTHNAGLGNADFLWAVRDLQPEEILRLFGRIEPSYSFRGGYTYQNIMYLVAGELITEVSGISWHQFMRDRLFAPLGMTHTFPSLKESQDYSNRSVPHHHVNGRITKIEDMSADGIAPAGAVWSTVEDMAKWMQFVLDKGKVGERQLISSENMEELLKPQVIIPQSSFYPTSALTKPKWTTYGLGFFQHDYYGRYVSFHTGSLAGTVAILGLIPDENLGVYVFGNLDHAEVRHAIMYKTFDLFGESDPGRNWSSEFLNLYTSLDKAADDRRVQFEKERISGTSPGREISLFTGVYSHDLYGEIRISFSENQLVLERERDHKYTLGHWHYNTFRARCLTRPYQQDSYLTFESDVAGELTVRWNGIRYERIKGD